MEHAQLFIELLHYGAPNATAEIYGSSEYPLLRGLAKFYNTYEEGILISIEVMGLPDSPESNFNFYALSIYQNGDCSENFSNVGEHLDLKGREHPFHSGDLPPLLSSDGYAWMTLYDDRLNIEDVLGRSIVVSNIPENLDSTSELLEPEKIACGVIIASR